AQLKRLYFHTVTRTLITAYRAVINISRHDHELFQRIRARGTVWRNNGVDVGKFQRAGSPAAAKTIIALNRFSSNKRLDRLIAFLAALRRGDPEWRLIIAGSESELSAADLRELAQRHGASEGVEILVGPSDKQIRRAMSRCSVLASASEYEGFGIVAIEGLSAGLLPLLSDIPSFRDLVLRTGAGCIVDFDRPDRAVDTFLAEWE